MQIAMTMANATATLFDRVKAVRAHMARYSGIHLCSFGTPAAEAEHLRLEAHGFAPEPAFAAVDRKSSTSL